MIPYGRQDIRQADIDAVVDVLRSDFLTQGPAVPQFESAISQKVMAEYAVAVNSATSALHIACAALDVGAGDLVWTSPITFVASANCALYCGADVDFVDIDPRTYNLCPDRLAEKLSAASATGRLPKVLIPVHLAGQPCDMNAIGKLARQYGVRVIEDASHAIGGRFDDIPIGACQHSDITVFSFHPVKIITTGEGGAAVTNDAALAQRMARLRSHGITRDPTSMTHAPDGPWYYQQIELGWNYRMTDIQAALGASQLSRLDDYVSRRHELAAHYDAAFEGSPITKPWRHANGHSAFHLYIVRLPTTGDRARHKAIFEKLRLQGIGVNIHYIPVHLQPFYQNLGFSEGDFPEAEAYYTEAMSLPLFPNLSEADLAYVVSNVIQAVRS